MMDAADRHAMEATNKSRTTGTEEVLMVVDPPRVGGVKVVPGADKKKLPTTSIVVKRATQRANARRNRVIQTKPDRVEPTPRNANSHTTLKAQEEPKWALPS